MEPNCKWINKLWWAFNNENDINIEVNNEDYISYGNDDPNDRSRDDDDNYW